MTSIKDEVLASMESMRETFKERNATYGENYIAVGKIMAALFPNGVTLKGEEAFLQFHFMDWCVGKLTRFSRTGMTHYDSIYDEAVYAVMLAAITKKMGEGNDNKE